MNKSTPYLKKVQTIKNNIHLMGIKLNGLLLKVEEDLEINEDLVSVFGDFVYGAIKSQEDTAHYILLFEKQLEKSICTDCETDFVQTDGCKYCPNCAGNHFTLEIDDNGFIEVDRYYESDCVCGSCYDLARKQDETIDYKDDYKHSYGGY